MENYAEFEMSGTKATEVLESLPASGLGWVVDIETSERLTTPGKRNVSVRGGQPLATIGFTEIASDHWKVYNVVPAQSRDLTIAEYNSVLLQFYDQYLRHHEGDPNFTSAPPRGHRDASEFLSQDGLELLTTFSELANKSSAGSHPLDYERWLQFVFYCHKVNVDFEGTLHGMLVDQDWDSETAHRLCEKYTTAVEILRKYDEWCADNLNR